MYGEFVWVVGSISVVEQHKSTITPSPLHRVLDSTFKNLPHVTLDRAANPRGQIGPLQMSHFALRAQVKDLTPPSFLTKQNAAL